MAVRGLESLLRQVEFRLSGKLIPQAHSVTLAGSFNEWSTAASRCAAMTGATGSPRSLFYPDTRAFFDEFGGPYIPGSDVSPLWNPEFFGNTIPRPIERRRDRSSPVALPFWQIGAEGGFLPNLIQLNQLLMGPAERADVIVDFTNVSGGTVVYLINEGWDDPITENPALNATEIWEMHNFTEDAHPIHIHEVQFQVVSRQPIAGGPASPPESWETGLKDTVVAYPDQITRVKAKFDLPGLYVWHCHIVEHEDNEMMRPYFIGPNPPQRVGRDQRRVGS